MDVNEAIVHALRGNSVLFLGAGYTFGATNSLPPPNNRVPDASTFAKRLARNLEIPKDYDLTIISQYYVSKKGEHGLITELINSFSITAVSDHHLEIAKVPWRRVYTTNYDNCFEFSALQTGSEWTALTLDRVPTAASKRCVHINGHIANLNIESLESQIRLTHSSYSADSFINSFWSRQFRQDLNAAKSVFFVGYSLADIDVARILHSSPDLRERTFFIVGPDEDDVVVFPLENYGSVLRIGVQALAEKIRSTQILPELSPHEYSWLKRYDADLDATQPDDKDGIDLLTMGVVEPAHVIWALGESIPTVFVRRSAIDEVLLELSRGRRWFLIHADLGNGKTVLKQQLSYILTRQGYTVFWDSEHEFARASDLRNLANEAGKVALFVDESPERFEVIEGLLTVNIEHIVVIVCVRTTLYELGESRYEEKLPNDYFPLDINVLTNADVTAFVQVLTKLGLWGQQASLNDLDKENFLKVRCGRNIARLILSVFAESEIGNRIRKEAHRFVKFKGRCYRRNCIELFVKSNRPPPKTYCTVRNP